jgi:DNA-directed RNA polymerase III subunit RPC8
MHRTAYSSAWNPPRSDPNERAYFWLPNSEATPTHELLELSRNGAPVHRPGRDLARARRERRILRRWARTTEAAEGVLISGQVQARRLPYTVTVSSPQVSCTGARPVL